MRSRIATITLLAVASLMLSSGAAFATSALSTDTNASALQYGGVQTVQPTAGGGGPVPAPPAQQTLGATDEGSVPPVNNVQQVAAGGGEGPEATPAAAAQEPRQLAAGPASDKSSLPFTGFALIPILLFGVALLAVGLVLRRRGGSAPASI